MIRVYFGLALAALLTLSGLYLHHFGYKSGVAHQVAITAAQNAKAAAEAQARTVAADAGAKQATDAGSVQVAQNEAVVHETVRTITKIVHDNPSPVACIAQPSVVHELQRAASAANSAASQLPVTRAK